MRGSTALLEILLPFLEKTQNSTYYRAFFKALQDLHGHQGKEIDKGSLQAVSEKINEAYSRTDWYDYVIKERCNNYYMHRAVIAIHYVLFFNY